MVENLCLMVLPMPQALKNAFAQLRKKSGAEPENRE